MPTAVTMSGPSEIHWGVDQLAGCEDRYFGGGEGGGTHLDADGVGAGLALDAARTGRDREAIGARASGVAQPAREDAEAVARLLGDRAVGVPDAHAEGGAQRRRRRGSRMPSEPMPRLRSRRGAHDQRGDGERRALFENQVVVAETVRFPEPHGEPEL